MQDSSAQVRSLGGDWPLKDDVNGSSMARKGKEFLAQIEEQIDAATSLQPQLEAQVAEIKAMEPQNSMTWGMLNDLIKLLTMKIAAAAAEEEDGGRGNDILAISSAGKSKQRVIDGLARVETFDGGERLIV